MLCKVYHLCIMIMIMMMIDGVLFVRAANTQKTNTTPRPYRARKASNGDKDVGWEQAALLTSPPPQVSHRWDAKRATLRVRSTTALPSVAVAANRVTKSFFEVRYVWYIHTTRDPGSR